MSEDVIEKMTLLAKGMKYIFKECQGRDNARPTYIQNVEPDPNARGLLIYGYLDEDKYGSSTIVDQIAVIADLDVYHSDELESYVNLIEAFMKGCFNGGRISAPRGTR